jgi:hypothetical protein
LESPAVRKAFLDSVDNWKPKALVGLGKQKDYTGFVFRSVPDTRNINRL